MGKATRWLKGLLGLKKDKEKERDNNIDASSTLSSEKKRWSFGKSGKDTNVSQQIPVKEDAWLSSYIAKSEREQNKHAIAVAAATAAAADAAVAAAQAAVAVVRLTSQGRGSIFGGSALKIQAVFRGYLARKALRALKGLVKLQALVRGYLVRKRAAATLHSMQALIRAQTNIRSQRARRSMNKENRYPKTRTRRSIERYEEDLRSDFHSKRISASYDHTTFEECPKIVEIDTYNLRSRSRRIPTKALSECGEDFHYQAISSPLPCPIPTQINIPESMKNPHFDWSFTGEKCRFSTAQSTPRFVSSTRSNVPPTPAKSICGDNYFRPYFNFPSYMASTQSFEAKLRSHSAPKQRPETPPKKRLSLNEIMTPRNSISSIKMQRPGYQVEDNGH